MSRYRGNDKPRVYFLRPVGEEGPVKIGVSVYPTYRLATYQQWSPLFLEIAAHLPGDERLEARFHNHFSRLHMHHEWFRGDPELSAMIATINAGAFDAATLCDRSDNPLRRQSERSNQARGDTHRITCLIDHGYPVPDHVRQAARSNRWNCADLARDREIVRVYVQSVLDEIGGTDGAHVRRALARTRPEAA